MAYKILYIEDLEAGSLQMDIQEFGIDVVVHKPINFEETFLKMCSDEFDAVLLDFRLNEETEHNIVFNAPSLAQNLRSINIDDKNYKPIFLITNQKNISSYYKDFTSHDLFDFVKTKAEFRENLETMCNRIISFIEAYKSIISSHANLDVIFNVDGDQVNYIDYRIRETLSNEDYSKNVNKIAFYIYHKVIKSFNFLIGKDVLLARLGINNTSPQLDELIKILDQFKYKGIYSKSHDRWWWNDIEKWWIVNSEGINLRRLKAGDRCQKLIDFTNFKDLVPASKLDYAKSDCFWTICIDKYLPLDPIDGLELIKKDLLPWQENEYISMLAALETSEKNKFINKIDFERMVEFSKTINL